MSASSTAHGSSTSAGVRCPAPSGAVSAVSGRSRAGAGPARRLRRLQCASVESERSRLPLVSVVTPSLNQGAYIEDTIRSVLEQDYPSIEHIVVDGGSSDRTVDILGGHPHVRWVSEPD